MIYNLLKEYQLNEACQGLSVMCNYVDNLELEQIYRENRCLDVMF